MTKKSLEQFLCDFFRDDDFIEVNAKWLQNKLMDSIRNERLAQAQLKEYRMQVDRLSWKIEAMKANQIIQDINSDVLYRLDERV